VELGSDKNYHPPSKIPGCGHHGASRSVAVATDRIIIFAHLLDDGLDLADVGDGARPVGLPGVKLFPVQKVLVVRPTGGEREAGGQAMQMGVDFSIVGSIGGVVVLVIAVRLFGTDRMRRRLTAQDDSGKHKNF